MTRFGKIGNSVLAAVLAFALALPAPALAFAAEGAESAADAGALQAATIDVRPAEATATDVNADIWDGTIDTSWYNTADKVFTLSKPAQLAGLAAIVNGTAVVNGTSTKIAVDTFQGKTVKLGADIVLNASAATAYDSTGLQRSWTPIGAMELTAVEDGSEGPMPRYNDAYYFDGTFDGQGHVVKNIYIYDNTEGTYGGVQALFANVGGHALIQNTGVDGGYVYGRVAAGLVAVSHAWEGAYPHIIGCYNTANVTCNGSSTRGAGGIFGGEEQYRGAENAGGANYHGGAYIANCYNTGTIGRLSTSNCSVGGIAGTGSVEIYGCYNYGQVDVGISQYSGSIAGNLIGPGANVGQLSEIAFEGTACVHDSYALEGTVPADEDSNVKLYNLIDATHIKGGRAEYCPAVTDADDVKFKPQSWFKTSEAVYALSQSFTMPAGASAPALYWQDHRAQIDFTMEDPRYPGYGYNYYEVWGIARQSYTGSPITPKVKVTFDLLDENYNATREVELHEGSDFTVKYANNTNKGTAAVTVTGMGRFYNAHATTFEIIDGNLDSTTIEPILAQWWYGSAVKPEVTVFASNGDTLKEGRDYQLTWTNANPTEWTPAAKEGAVPTAKAKVTVTPLDEKFSGSKELEFTVLKASTSLSGSGAANDPKLISSKADLQFLAYKTHTGDDLAAYSGYCYKVTADIDARSTDPEYMVDRPCDPLFTAWGDVDASGNEIFKYGLGGTFDGDGHTITLGQTEAGVSFDLSAALAFMIYTKSGSSATVKNLTIDGSVLCPHGAAAGFLIMGQSGSITFENCVNKATVRGDAFYQGGAAGFIVQTSSGSSSSLVMTRCTNEGAITSAAGRAAGFVGALGGRGGSLSGSTPTYANTFDNCVNKGAVTGGMENGAGGFVAVVLGLDSSSDASGRTTLFERCLNESTGEVTMSSSGDVGGFVGVSQNKVGLLKFDRCGNEAILRGTGTGNNGGGIIGRVYNTAELTNCYNTGDVKMLGSMSNNGAGLVGYFGSGYNDSTSLTLRNVYATGTFTGPDADSGGLVGNIWLHTNIVLDNAYYDSSSASRWVHWNPADEYPSAVSPPVITGQATAVDAGVMKTNTFVSQLGIAFAADSADEPANKGFPVIGASDREVVDLGSGGVEMTVEPTTWQYTGAPVRPTVTLETGGGILTEGADYVVFYVPNADGTTYRAIAQGIGSYTGSIMKQFTVTACPITSCSISAAQPMNYSDIAGIGATQSFVVKNPAGNVMTEGVDYQVAYSHNDEAGTAYAYVEGIGPHYSGSMICPFTISVGDLGDASQVRVEDVQSHYPIANGTGGLYVYESLYANSGYSLKRADRPEDNGDYVRQFYDENGDIVKTANGNAAVSIEKAGTYTVKFIGNGVRDLGNGTTQVWTNGNWTGVAQKTFTYGNRIAVDADISGVQSQYGYTGKAISIAPSLVNNLTDYPLTKDVDYTMRIVDARGNAVESVVYSGDYKVVITGKDTWFGTAEIPFEVVPSEYFITDSTVVSGIDSLYLHTGSPIKPVPTSVKVGGKTLSPSTDYTVSYVDAKGNAVASPTEAGAYYAVITGVGLYGGSKSVPFTIEKPLISVYVRDTDTSAPRLAKSYTRDAFRALKSTGDPVSALYSDLSGTNWSVATTAEYVTLADLLADAGVKWGAGESLTYGGSVDKPESSYTYEQLQGLMFYPMTTRTSTDSFGGVAAPFVFSITDFSSPIGTAGTHTAYDVEQFNLKNTNSTNSPRVIMGVQPSDYYDARANGDKLRGLRLWNNTSVVTVTLTASSTPDPTPSDDPTPTPTPTPSTDTVTSVSMFRMYNPYSGEHLYTSAASERDGLAAIGWHYEGIAWKAPSSGTPVYRVYNPNSGDHHYTTDKGEYDALGQIGWKQEGLAWYSADSSGVPLYRLFNPNVEIGTHHYTTDANERDTLVRIGWQSEGVGWYGLK